MLSARSELGRGGRIASLVSSSGQEWLWHGARASERDGLGPSPNFVDIGGVDERVRTISGTPDHGAMWTKVGEGSDEDAVASTDEFVLHRRIISADAPVLNSHLVAEPGHRLLLAWHALVELEPGLSNGVPPRGGRRARLAGRGAPNGNDALAGCARP
ncbi:MAG: hypothetical protein M0014_15520 [Actinomycetota bacterium]|nr:hypothetical protein [Actinomycetota bacterium]